MAGIVVSCDQAALDLFCVPGPEAVVGKHVIDLLAPTSQQAARDRLLATDVGTPRSQLMDFRHGEADDVTAAVDSTPAVWDHQPARRVRLTPIIDPGIRLRRLVTGILGDLADAVIITDLHFHIRSWNAAAERLYGWREGEGAGAAHPRRPPVGR